MHRKQLEMARDSYPRNPRIFGGGCEFVDAVERVTNLCMSAKLENSETRGTPKVRRPLDSLKVSKTKKQSIGRSPQNG
jgi:hypothetical protein